MLIPFESCIKHYGKPFSGVLHIGAHLGEEAQSYSANGVKQVVWVEANKTLMNDLYNATRHVPVKQLYVCAALSDVDGEKVIFRITNNGQSSSILPLGTHLQHYPEIQVIESREVTTCRFDSLCRQYTAEIEIDAIDFVNIDVQGAELKVLKGFGDILTDHPNIKAVYTEVNFEEVYIGAPHMNEIAAYLGRFGFKHVATAAVPQKWGDSLFVRR